MFKTTLKHGYQYVYMSLKTPPTHNTKYKLFEMSLKTSLKRKLVIKFSFEKSFNVTFKIKRQVLWGHINKNGDKIGPSAKNL